VNNPLTDIVPAPVRKIIYSVYAALGLVLSGSQVGLSAANVDQPVWLTVTLAIYAFFGTALGATAASNTEPVKGR
jgi:hypothetical protein